MKIIFYLAFILLSLTSCENRSENDSTSSEDDSLSIYEMEILQSRFKTNKKFKNPETSPLVFEDIQLFDSLDYFEIDTAYRLWAKLKKVENSDTIPFPTTTNRKPRYYIYAKANFKLKDQYFELNIYRNVAFMNDSAYKKHLFLPFSDYTSGAETYGGGRYLDLEITDSSHILIDFNKAYNPYCAYNSKYSCPIPPKENYIEAEINAGVKNFKH